MTRTPEVSVHLVAGHDLIKDSGAIAQHEIMGSLKEADKTVDYRYLLRNELDFLGLHTTVDDDTMGLREVIAILKRTVRPNDIVIDIHFNAADSKKANGSEVLIPRDSNQIEKYLATEFQKVMVATMGTRDRGVKDESQSFRKTLGIMRVPCNVILLELGFITNDSDMDKYQMYKHMMAARHADIIYELVNKKYKK